MGHKPEVYSSLEAGRSILGNVILGALPPLVDPIMPVRPMAALFCRDFGMQGLIITPPDYDGEKWGLFRED